MSQYGGVAERHAQAGQQPFGRAPTDGMTEQPYDAGHARGASCARGCEIRSTLSESATFTLIISSKPSGHPGVDQDRRPLCRQVLKRSDIRPVPGFRPRPADRTVCVTMAVHRDRPPATAALYKRDLLLRHGRPQC
jgi:hypothetical protein